MTDDEILVQKNNELLARQAEAAALRSLVDSTTRPASTVIQPVDIQAIRTGRPEIDGLVERLRNVPREEDPERESYRELSLEAARIKRLRDSGVPERYLAETFDTFEIRGPGDELNRDSVRQFFNDSESSYNGFLVMLGSVGTGKTHLACAGLQIRSGEYVDIPTLEVEVECSRDFSAPENKLKVLNRYTRSDFLIVDEIGRASSPAAEKAILYYILNKRYNYRLSTVLISNMNDQEFSAYLGAAIIDRIAEKRVKLDFNGESYRRRK